MVWSLSYSECSSSALVEGSPARAGRAAARREREIVGRNCGRGSASKLVSALRCVPGNIRRRGSWAFPLGAHDERWRQGRRRVQTKRARSRRGCVQSRRAGPPPPGSVARLWSSGSAGVSGRVAARRAARRLGRLSRSVPDCGGLKGGAGEEDSENAGGADKLRDESDRLGRLRRSLTLRLSAGLRVRGGG